MNERVCNTCTRLLPLDAFAPKRAMCRECQAFKKASWRAQNRLRLRRQNRNYMRTWRKRNPGYSGRKTPRIYKPDRHREYKAKYLAKPGILERTRAKAREYYWKHRDEILAQKKRKKLERPIQQGDDR